MTHVESREAEAEGEDDAVKRTEEFDDRVDLTAEIWGSVCDGARDNVCVWSEDTAEQEELRDATRLEAACRNALSITVHHGSMTKTTTKTTETMHRLTNEHTMHASVTVDGEACSAVTVTLRSPDPALLVIAQAAVDACLRVYRSLLAEPRLVAGAGAAELALAAGPTREGLGLVGVGQLSGEDKMKGRAL
ncbi:hypothetical protein CRUP_017081 [Coryphaenoides rupestris]|nr:hypothetical protein CRUP_017081 [Coryphaenoides rupestris]